MIAHWRRTCLAAALAALVLPATARAQKFSPFDSPPEQNVMRRTISAVGVATVRQRPTHIRFRVPLSARGKTMEEALAKLEKRKAAAVAQLKTLKTENTSIVFGGPSWSDDHYSRKRRIQAALIARMRSDGKKIPKDLLAPPGIAVVSLLTARWPVESDSPEKLLISYHGLREKLRVLDIAGANEKDDEKLTPEEKELEEEANQTQGQDDEQPKADQSDLVLLAVPAKKEREKALAEAFVKAKQQASELAKAAGVELGPLVAVSGGPIIRTAVESDTRGDNEVNVMRRMAEEQAAEHAEDGEVETSGNNPLSLKFNYYIAATFQLGK
jgi:uncharacterized protein YggE